MWGSRSAPDICSIATFVRSLQAVPHTLDNLPLVAQPILCKYNILSNFWLFYAKYHTFEEFSISKIFLITKYFFLIAQRCVFPLDNSQNFLRNKDNLVGMEVTNKIPNFFHVLIFRQLKKVIEKPVLSFYIRASSIFFCLNRSPCFSWWLAPRNLEGNLWKSKTWP